LNEKSDQLLDIGNLQSLFSYFVGFTGNFFITLFSITFITFFFVKDDKLPKQIILGIVPDRYTRRAHRVLVQAELLLTRYFIGLILQISSITLVAYIGLTIIGIKNALLIGFFAGVVNIIPYLGPIIGALFGTFVAISTNLELQTANELLSVIFQVFLVFGVVQMMDNMVFQPLIFSSSVKAHPLEVFIIVLVGGRLGGILGMVAAIPTYTFIRIVAKEFLNEFEVVKRLTYKL
jgi:predicted PurR-regulated permease PerM